MGTGRNTVFEKSSPLHLVRLVPDYGRAAQSRLVGLLWEVSRQDLEEPWWAVSQLYGAI